MSGERGVSFCRGPKGRPALCCACGGCWCGFNTEAPGDGATPSWRVGGRAPGAITHASKDCAAVAVMVFVSAGSAGPWRTGDARRPASALLAGLPRIVTAARQDQDRPSCSLAAALERIRCAYCGFGVADGVGAVPVGAASFFFFFFFGGCMAGC
jgi:hypothetical protein